MLHMMLEPYTQRRVYNLARTDYPLVQTHTNSQIYRVTAVRTKTNYFFIGAQPFNLLLLHIQILQGSAPVLMVTNVASWRLYLHRRLPPDGAAVASPTLTLGSLQSGREDVSPMYLPKLWATQSVAMESERVVKCVTVEVLKSAQILAVMPPPVNQRVVLSAVLVLAVLALVSLYRMGLSVGHQWETVTSQNTAQETRANAQPTTTNGMEFRVAAVLATALMECAPHTMLSVSERLVCL